MAQLVITLDRHCRTCFVNFVKERAHFRNWRDICRLGFVVVFVANDVVMTSSGSVG